MLSWFGSCCGGVDDERDRPGSEKKPIVVLRGPTHVYPPTPQAQWPSLRARQEMMDREREQERRRPRSRRQRSNSQDSGSVRLQWFGRSPSTASSATRPRISGPTNFRHLNTDPFQIPGPSMAPEAFERPMGKRTPPQRPKSFRPLELSIYMPHNRLSAILPHVEERLVSPPPRAYTSSSGNSRWDDSSATTVAGERSYSALSFHIPRKHVRAGSTISSAASVTPPRIPPKSRARAQTAPTNDIVARIASAMVERDRLQAEIDSVVERQSVYVGSSRPSTSQGGRTASLYSVPESAALDASAWEPMPPLPALPPAAPSFAQRLQNDRPKTAPSRATIATTTVSVQERTRELAAMAFGSHPPEMPVGAPRPPSELIAELPATPLPLPPQQQEKLLILEHQQVPQTPTDQGDPDAEIVEFRYIPEPGELVNMDLDRPLAPPLPLVLRPPLRKKKSFSRVSNWLFPVAEDGSIPVPPPNVLSAVGEADGALPAALALTNAPRPIREGDGFYQCVAPPEGLPRTSMETSSSVYTWETTDDEEAESSANKTATTPHTWGSPGSSPRVKQVGAGMGTPPRQTPTIEQTAKFDTLKTSPSASPRVKQGTTPKQTPNTDIHPPRFGSVAPRGNTPGNSPHLRQTGTPAQTPKQTPTAEQAARSIIGSPGSSPRVKSTPKGTPNFEHTEQFGVPSPGRGSPRGKQTPVIENAATFVAGSPSATPAPLKVTGKRAAGMGVGSSGVGMGIVNGGQQGAVKGRPMSVGVAF